MTAAATQIDDRKAKRNVFVLAAAGALGGSVPPIVFAIVAIAAYDLLGDDKSLATVPITAFVVGTACGTVPAAMLMRRIGRRPGFIVGLLLSCVGALTEAVALAWMSFALLCVGSFVVGFAQASVQQFRFAAADTATPAFRPRAISLVMAGGVAAAVIGPQTVIYLADSIATVPYAGAFLGGAALALAGALILLFLDIPHVKAPAGHPSGRPLGEIVRRPDFLIAVGCATCAFALMSFVMTAAPLAMVLHDHHRDAAVLGIQWHVLAMFGPSFFTGSLIQRFGAERVVATGLLLLIGCALTALAGASVAHFWAALILLGLGWNFGFIGGTALLTETYRPEEKEKVQAFNDFLVFGLVAVASYSSGEILLVAGWNVVNIVVLPVAAICLAALFWQMARKPRPA